MNAKPAGDSVLALVPSPTTWTEEEWAARDARIASERAAESSAARAKGQADRRARYLSAGFPLRAIEAAEVANETAAIVAVKEWKPTDSILLLSGLPGCGKTVAATWWAHRCGFVPVFLRATEFAASSRYDDAKRAGWLDAPGLVLDDLGTEYADAKGSFLVDLDELVDRFYGNRKPLLITTNCTVDVFKKRYGTRIEDRVRECGSFQSIGSPSLRRRG